MMMAVAAAAAAPSAADHGAYARNANFGDNDMDWSTVGCGSSCATASLHPLATPPHAQASVTAHPVSFGEGSWDASWSVGGGGGFNDDTSRRFSWGATAAPPPSPEVMHTALCVPSSSPTFPPGSPEDALRCGTIMHDSADLGALRTPTRGAIAADGGCSATPRALWSTKPQHGGPDPLSPPRHRHLLTPGGSALSSHPVADFDSSASSWEEDHRSRCSDGDGLLTERVHGEAQLGEEAIADVPREDDNLDGQELGLAAEDSTMTVAGESVLPPPTNQNRPM
jgi:hypothetical protein